MSLASPKVGSLPAFEQTIVPADDGPPQARRRHATRIRRRPLHVHRHRHALRDLRREARRVRHAVEQRDDEHDDAREDGEPGPLHLDPVPAQRAADQGQDQHIRQLEGQLDAGADNGAGQPLPLPDAGQDDAADAARVALADVVDVAVTVQDGDAEGLEERRAPRDGRRRGARVHGLGGRDEADDLKDEDGDEEEDGRHGGVDGGIAVPPKVRNCARALASGHRALPALQLQVRVLRFSLVRAFSKVSKVG